MPADKFDRALTVVLATAAVLIATVAVRRELTGSTPAPRPAALLSTTEAAWKDALPVGVRVGDSTARFTMVVFSDLECPACRRFHQTAQRVLGRHEDVSMVFVHFPLPAHRFAVPAAKAAECASAQGRFMKFVDVAFAKQDSIGLKSWASYGQDAGVSDTATFAKCARDSSVVQRIEAGRELGLRLQLQGTPTVLINDHRYLQPPTLAEVEQTLDEMRNSSAANMDRGKTTQVRANDIARGRLLPRGFLRDSNIVVTNVMQRFFNGIELSADQDSAAAAIIKRTWREQFLPKLGTPTEQFDKAESLNAARDSALKALLKPGPDQARFERNAKSSRNY